MPASGKSTQVEDAYSRIKEEIRTNRMPPWFQAPEPEIATRLGLSRTPVREALIRLSSEGLVELIPRRGVRVLPIHADDMQEITDILTIPEPEAVDRFHRKLPELNGNRCLSEFGGSLYDQAHRARMITIRPRALPVDSTREHREYLNISAREMPAGYGKLFASTGSGRT